MDIFDPATNMWSNDYGSPAAAQAALAAGVGARAGASTWDGSKTPGAVPQPGAVPPGSTPSGPGALSIFGINTNPNTGMVEIPTTNPALAGVVAGGAAMTMPTVTPGSAPTDLVVYGTPLAVGSATGTIATILAKLKSLSLLGKLPAWAVTALAIAGTAATVWGIWEALKAAGIVSSADEISGGGGGYSGGDAGYRGASGTRDGRYLLSGPGVPEPAAGTFYNSWRTAHERKGTFLNGYTWYWALNDGRIVCYTDTTGRARVWRPQKPAAVLMRGGKTSLSQAVKAQRLLDKMWRTVAKRTKQLKLA